MRAKVPARPRRSRRLAVRGAALGAAFVASVAVGACARPVPAATASAAAAPSAGVTARPELAWSRAAVALPAEVVEVAPGTSVGMPCAPCHAAQASLLLGVVATGDGLLAVGVQQPPSRAIAYRSRDGRTWAPEAGFAPGEETLALAAAADGVREVIVGRNGSDATAWTTSDGRTWRAARAGAVLRAPPGGTAQMSAVVAWRGQFVAVGHRDADAERRTAAVWVSDDGLDWQLVSDGPAFDDARATGIAATRTSLVAVGTAGPVASGRAVAWVSGDGQRWSRIDSPAFDAGQMRAVTAAASGFVAVGSAVANDRAVAWTSPDGRAWSVAQPSRDLEAAGNAIRMSAVATDGAGLIAAGWKSDAGNGSGVVWRSEDGRAWRRLPDQVSMSGASLAGVVVLAGLPVVVGTSGSPDNDQASGWYEGS